MLDLIKEGIKNSENLAALPFKAVREITGDANQTVAELTGLTEEIVSIPFIMASQAIESIAVGESQSAAAENKTASTQQMNKNK
jgi:hypothetical protein